MPVYRLLRFVVVTMSILIFCYYDFYILVVYIQYDIIVYTICLYVICGMAMGWAVALVGEAQSYVYHYPPYFVYYIAMFTMLRFDFDCT